MGFLIYAVFVFSLVSVTFCTWAESKVGTAMALGGVFISLVNIAIYRTEKDADEDSQSVPSGSPLTRSENVGR